MWGVCVVWQHQREAATHSTHASSYSVDSCAFDKKKVKKYQESKLREREGQERRRRRKKRRRKAVLLK